MSGHKVSGRRGEAGQRPGPQDEARSLLSTLKTRTHKAVSPNHSLLRTVTSVRFLSKETKQPWSEVRATSVTKQAEEGAWGLALLSLGSACAGPPGS